MSDIHRGSCLCGKVTFTVEGPMGGVVACHCSQCRKQSGHYYTTTEADDDRLAIEGEGNLKWYRASPQARRGFCAHCGSALFWKRDGSATTSVLAGSLDGPTGLRMERHIFCADKGDYYDIDDGLPQSQGR